MTPTIPQRSLTELDSSALESLVTDLGEKPYRGRQIYAWVHARRARHLDEMTNVPRSLRDALAADGWGVGCVEVAESQISRDATRKLSLRLADGAAVETVLLRMSDGRYTQCLSTQVGCQMGCAFCFTASLGFHRNLTVGEMVDQVIVAQGLLPEGERIKNLVFMGMGEPLQNLDNLLDCIARLTDRQGLAYSSHRITVSTCGLVPGIRALAEADAGVHLALSLNATTDAVRDVVMPVNRRYPIEDVLQALRDWPLAPQRRLTVEYVLLAGRNDADDDARRLARLLRGLPARVNLLPFNPFEGAKFERPGWPRVRAFQSILEAKGCVVTVRTPRGRDIDAACGQLGERPRERP